MSKILSLIDNIIKYSEFINKLFTNFKDTYLSVFGKKIQINTELNEEKEDK